MCDIFGLAIYLLRFGKTKGIDSIRFRLLPNEIKLLYYIQFLLQSHINIKRENSGSKFTTTLTYHASVALLCAVPIDFARAILRH